MLRLGESIGIRVISLIAVLGFVFFVPSVLLLVIAIAIAEGHFGLAYIYQAEGGHLSHTKLLLLAAVALLLGSFVFFGWVAVLGFVNGVGFIIHFSLDEARLLNGKHSWYTTLEALPAIALLTGVFAESQLTLDWFVPAVLFALACILTYAVLMLWNRRAPNTTSYTFYVWTTISFLAYDFVRFAPERAFKVFWIVALLHFAIWYGFYWYKLKRAPEARATFVTRTLVVNSILLVLVVISLTHPEIAVLGALFSSTLFFVFSLLHGIASIRPQELLASVRLRE